MKRIGRYTVCGLLGRGGMGTVYKVRLPYIERTVALKLFSPHPTLVSLMGYQAVRSLFISEATRIASLRSPNIAEILDFDFDGERPFFTMEYYYHDLGALIGEGARVEHPTRILSLDKTIHYARQILEGIARMSRAGIVHRDIKPGNLLISDEDRIKICDFGFSRLRGEKLGSLPHLLVGSPYYAAPEQQEDPDKVDQRADLYSTGVIVHRLVTGLLPEEGICKPSRLHPDADPEWDVFLEKALDPDPDHRYASAEDMLGALEALASSWAKRKENICRLFTDPRIATSRAEAQRRLRSVPVKTGTKAIPSFFHCDELMRPHQYAEAALQAGPSDGTVSDPATGLVWQRSGSEDRLSWREAHQYVARLNEIRFGGIAGWRLPTIAELFSILRPPVPGSTDCIGSDFDKRQKMLWSSDRRTFVSAWFLNMELGFAGSSDISCAFYTRAVSESTAPRIPTLS